MYLTDERDLAALIRFREKVIADPKDKPAALDCDERGAKETWCSWGLCSKAKGDWPEQDFLFPDLEGRLDAKYRSDRHLCPYDTRQPYDSEISLMQGCFHTCRYFKRKANKRPTKEQVIQLYNIRIADSERRTKQGAA